MTHLFAYSLYAHIGAILLMLLIIILQFLVINFMDNTTSLVKTVKFGFPIYHACNAIIIYTGILISLQTPFHFNIVYMIFASLFLLISEILIYKKFKYLQPKKEQKNEINFAKRITKYQTGIVLVVLILELVF